MGADETTREGGWLDRAKTEGDASAFLPGGGQGINVSPDGVKVFASQVNGESTDFVKSSSDGVMSMAGESNRIGASFMEAEAFALDHAAGFEALTMFSTDVHKGLMALGTGAASIAITYLNGDTTTAATLKDVQDAFDVSGGQGMFNGPQAPAGPDRAATGGNTLPRGPVGDDHYNTYDPHDSRTIHTGDGTYTVPADANDDLERLDPNELREVYQQYADDLGKMRD